MSAEFPLTSPQLERAERLISHCLSALEQAEQRRSQDRQRLAFEVEQLLLPLDQLSGGLSGVIESMAADRQDNRLQRWQGQLQQLLDPLDSSLQLLRDLRVTLEHDPKPAPATTSTPQQQKSEQLLQLLALRQKQVLQLESQVIELRQQLFDLQQRPEPEATAEPAKEPAAAQANTPSIFS
jgi:hypothetical protein